MQGVYKITNTVNGKFYVGSAINIKRRWTVHRYKLRHNKHDNKHLQSAWNKYGESAFEFSIIELCEDSLQKEQHYLDALKPEYNKSGIATHVEMTPEVRRKISEACKRNFQGEGNPASKITEDDVREIRRRLSNGETCKQVAKDYCLGIGSIYNIKQRRTWGWLD